MGDIPPISPVEDAIVALHNVIGNADPSGHHVVLGFGSTQVMAVRCRPPLLLLRLPTLMLLLCLVCATYRLRCSRKRR